jgi:hypothetical protein
MLKQNIDSLVKAEEPWVVYRTMRDLMELKANEPKVVKVKEQMLKHPLMQGLLGEMHNWPGTVLNSHKSAGQLYHKLAFLADMGFTTADDDLSVVVKKVKEQRSEEGLFQLPMNIPVHFGGTGKDVWAWALCDAPLLMYSVVKMDEKNKNERYKGVDFLLSLKRDNGWPCVVSKEQGKFRGPGRKDDPCPYVNLIMLKLLTLFPEYKDSPASRTGVEGLLNCWETSKERHPYMFYMGTDFRKLKAPFIWYDILHVADVLSQYDFALNDPRFIEMLNLINAKASKDGLFTPESVWKAWEGWDFGQKTKPSPWVTFLVYRINERAGNYQKI